MSVGWNADYRSRLFLLSERRVDDDRAGVSQTLHNHVVGKAGGAQILWRNAHEWDQRAHAVFVLRQLYRSLQHADVDLHVAMIDPMAVGLDQHSIGGGVFEPFAKEKVCSFVALTFVDDDAILHRITRRVRSPIRLAGRSLRMP